MVGEKIHVIPHPDGGWQVKRDGASRAIGIYKTKKEALAKAKELSGNTDSFIIEHSTEGKVQNVSKSKKVEKDLSTMKIHVVPNAKGGWSIKREGSTRVLANFDTKDEAMARAKVISGNSDAHLVEHSAGGKIQNVTKSKKAEKKPEAKKAPAKKPAAKKAEKKPAAAKKPAAKKAAPKKAEKKPVATKKAPAKKPAAKKAEKKPAAAKKPAAKKAAPKKTVKKPTAKECATIKPPKKTAKSK